MTIAVMLTALVAASAAPTDTAGVGVIRAMHERYAGKWYENLALVQTVNYYDVQTGAYDSARIWYESIRLPGVVRSDIAPLDAGNSQLFRDNTWYFIEADSVIRQQSTPHPILLLGFDVYVQPVDETLAALRRIGFDLTRLREADWQGRPAYVVGDESRQFWVDRENLLLVRLHFKNPTSGAERDVVLDAYEPLGGGWIATQLRFMRNGRTDMLERYDYWTIEVEFPDDLFAVRDRARPAWVRN
jgi:hypothetical protein